MELSARHSVILSMEIVCKEGLTRSPDLKLGPKILICVLDGLRIVKPKKFFRKSWRNNPNLKLLKQFHFSLEDSK